jgi:hypothetical protein
VLSTVAATPTATLAATVAAIDRRRRRVPGHVEEVSVRVGWELHG